MTDKFKEQFDWGRVYIPGIKRIVGPTLLIEAPVNLDQKEATDLMILEAKDLRIACRMRKPEYLKRYPFDFTIRKSVPNGAQTELKKILNGFGDRFFYGFADPVGVAIASWHLIDLNCFRAAYYALLAKKAKLRKNEDQTTFYAWNVRDCPPEMIIAASWLSSPDRWVVRWEGQRDFGF